MRDSVNDYVPLGPLVELRVRLLSRCDFPNVFTNLGIQVIDDLLLGRCLLSSDEMICFV